MEGRCFSDACGFLTNKHRQRGIVFSQDLFLCSVGFIAAIGSLLDAYMMLWFNPGLVTQPIWANHGYVDFLWLGVLELMKTWPAVWKYACLKLGTSVIPPFLWIMLITRLFPEPEKKFGISMVIGVFGFGLVVSWLIVLMGVAAQA